MRFVSSTYDQENRLIRVTTANGKLGINHATRVIFDFAFGDSQDMVWRDYLTNIGNHWENTQNAKVEGP